MRISKYSLELRPLVWEMRCKGMTYEAISQKLNIPSGTLVTLIRKYKKQLAEQNRPKRARAPKLTPKQVAEVRQLLAKGYTRGTVSNITGVGLNTISRIANGKSYADVA